MPWTAPGAVAPAPPPSGAPPRAWRRRAARPWASSSSWPPPRSAARPPTPAAWRPAAAPGSPAGSRLGRRLFGSDRDRLEGGRGARARALQRPPRVLVEPHLGAEALLALLGLLALEGAVGHQAPALHVVREH